MVRLMFHVYVLASTLLVFYGKAWCISVLFWYGLDKKTVQHHFFAFTQAKRRIAGTCLLVN